MTGTGPSRRCTLGTLGDRLPHALAPIAQSCVLLFAIVLPGAMADEPAAPRATPEGETERQPAVEVGRRPPSIADLTRQQLDALLYLGRSVVEADRYGGVGSLGRLSERMIDAMQDGSDWLPYFEAYRAAFEAWLEAQRAEAERRGKVWMRLCELRSVDPLCAEALALISALPESERAILWPLHFDAVKDALVNLRVPVHVRFLGPAGAVLVGGPAEMPVEQRLTIRQVIDLAAHGVRVAPEVAQLINSLIPGAIEPGAAGPPRRAGEAAHSPAGEASDSPAGGLSSDPSAASNQAEAGGQTPSRSPS